MSLARFLYRSDAGAVLKTLIGEAQHSPTLAESLQKDFLDPLRDILGSMLSSSEPRWNDLSALDREFILDDMLSPMFYRRIVACAAITDAYVLHHANKVTEQLIRQLTVSRV